VPTFCRHNRFLANCPICGREQREAAAPRRAATGSRTRPTARPASRRGGDVRVRRVARAGDDGFRSPLVAGLKASGDAQRLAVELAFATGRLGVLAGDPPGLYAEVAGTADIEEATWLAFLIAYLGPLEGDDPFAGVRAVRVPWASGALPSLDDAVLVGPRTAHDPGRGAATLAAYRAWARRAGSQAAALSGEAAWTPERRFARAFERLALPGLYRDARFEFLVTVGQLGRYALRAGGLQLGGADETTVAAKRIFGIGDTLLLERRAGELAAACEIPLAALDLALWNWSRPPGARATQGLPSATPDAAAHDRVAGALGL
jgi:hypothetical protein